MARGTGHEPESLAILQSEGFCTEIETFYILFSVNERTLNARAALRRNLNLLIGSNSTRIVRFEAYILHIDEWEFSNLIRCKNGHEDKPTCLSGRLVYLSRDGKGGGLNPPLGSGPRRPPPFSANPLPAAP